MPFTTEVCARHAGGALAPAPGGRVGRKPDRKRSGGSVLPETLNKSLRPHPEISVVNDLREVATLQPSLPRLP